MSKTKGFLLAVAVAAMAFTFSCSSDDGNGGGNPPGGGGVSGGLFCADGEAWVRNNSGGDNGLIIRSNGQCFELEVHGGKWYFEESFTCSVSGDTFTIGETETYTYSVSGDQLTTQRGNSTRVYTKTSGINPLEP